MSEAQARAEDGLTGKVALVVGGGWAGPDDYAIGIGGAICQHLTRAGVRVAVLDIADAHAERTLAPIRAEGGDAIKVIADTAIEADCQRAVSEVVTHYGQLDILINNVGPGSAPGYARGSEEEFDRLMAVNFRGEILMAKHAVPHMPRGGAIVNVGSVMGAIDPVPGVYGVSKRAVSLVATPTLAAQYAPQGIRVNCVSVGFAWNALTQSAQALQAPDSTVEEYRAGRAEALTALRVEGDGWDVANAVAFLASDKARWITGQDLIVDGGYGLLTVFDMSRFGRNFGASQHVPTSQ
ncbi:MAG TPA: SDR family oxidoreductase [Streptosporangiaceae bacterium]|nr:SDR family oxidoreductase [Streptosporangiaceae bacterium]